MTEDTLNQNKISGTIEKGDFSGPLHTGPWANFFTLRSTDMDQDFKHKRCLVNVTYDNIEVVDEPAEFLRVKDKVPLGRNRLQALEETSTVYVHWNAPKAIQGLNLHGAVVLLHSISEGFEDSALANAKIR